MAESDTAPPQDVTPSRLPSQSEELEELLRHKPSATGVGGRLVMMLIFGLMLVGLIVFFFIVSTIRGDAPPIFQILFAMFGLGGLAMVVGGIRGLVKLSRSPLLRLPAVVVGKRHKTSGGRYSQEVCLLTIQTEDGNTREHAVSDTLFAEVEEGDTGVAYLKGGFLLDFKRVRVPKA